MDSRLVSLEGVALATQWVSERRVDDAYFGTEAAVAWSGWGFVVCHGLGAYHTK